jgi:hypothetical protein
MKTKVSTRGLVIAGMLFAFAHVSGADIEEFVKAKMLTGQRVFIEVQNPQQKPMSIEFINSTSGERVYFDDISNPVRFSNTFNLSQLPEGNYTMKYSISNRIYTKEMSMSASESVILAENFYLTPTISQEGKNLLVTVFNADEKDVKVTFRQGLDGFFTDKPGISGSFKRNYNIAELYPGEYNVRVVSGDEAYHYSFEVK